MQRSALDISNVYDHVRGIVEDVRKRGDAALLEANREFKHDVRASELEATPEEVEKAFDQVEKKLIEALKTAAKNITTFHQAQRERETWSIEVAEGVVAGRMIRPMERVGCYIPGGRAAYPSTVLMTVIPSKGAGRGGKGITQPPCNEGGGE